MAWRTYVFGRLFPVLYLAFSMFSGSYDWSVVTSPCRAETRRFGFGVEPERSG